MHKDSPDQAHNFLSVNRRQFLKAGLAVLLPQSAFANINGNPDVVIVGAGAAGIAAAHTLIKDTRKVAILEGRGRVGGRTHTDNTIFNAPYDVGAHWMHNGRQNPYNFLARKFGFDLQSVPENYRMFAGNQEVGEDEIDKMWEVYSELEVAIGKSADAGQDISASAATEHIDGRWSNTAKFAMGPWGMGKDLKDFSTVDWWNSADGEDFFCSQGFGTIVARYAEGLKVSFNTQVEKIDWSGDEVAVETTNGSLRTRAVIVTASNGVLASDTIRFSPQLPLEKQESFHAISMGAYDHFALQFSEDIFGMGNDGYLLYEIADDGRGFGTLTNASGTGIAYCDVGGDWARELSDRPQEEKIDYALNQLEKLLGSSVRNTFLKGSATAWNQDKWTLGSYASAEPGAFAMRQVLRRPVGDRIFFAGEACHRSMWATVGGAHLSGIETAKVVSGMLG